GAGVALFARCGTGCLFGHDRVAVGMRRLRDRFGTPGDTSMATLKEVEKLVGGAGARVDR
ncbi:MAG: hypothetical protein IKS67_14445, partial [Victivallales bacterium]|nr:hypothetical protein [Victivallales bacterium]